MKQLPALTKAIQSLHLRPEHDLLVAYCKGMAEQIDAHPERATLWREYRPALETLLAVSEVPADDGQTAFLRLVSGEVGDAAPTGAKDAGAGAGSGRGTVGPTADAVAAPSRRRRSGAAS